MTGFDAGHPQTTPCPTSTQSYLQPGTTSATTRYLTGNGRRVKGVYGKRRFFLLKVVLTVFLSGFQSWLVSGLLSKERLRAGEEAVGDVTQSRVPHAVDLGRVSRNHQGKNHQSPFDGLDFGFPATK